jgi:hypothetical protein
MLRFFSNWGKSFTNDAICRDKKPSINITINAAAKITSTIAMISGIFIFRKNRNMGNSMRLMKKAISKGIMIAFATEKRAMIKHNPKSSMERFTVKGN